jgi:hypothetical protein
LVDGKVGKKVSYWADEKGFYLVLKKVVQKDT